jgi:hypothetical protein
MMLSFHKLIRTSGSSPTGALLWAGLLLLALCLGSSSAADEKTSQKPPVVVLLNPAPPVPHFTQVIHDTFRGLGYELGRNLVYTEY